MTETNSDPHRAFDGDDAKQEQVLFRALFDAMPQLGWTAQPDGFIDYYNRGWYEYTGTDYDQMQGWGWQSVHDPAHLPRAMEQWRRGIDSGQPVEMEFPLRRHDGVFRWFLTRIQPIYDETGTLLRWVGINTDIEDQKRAQEALREINAERAQALGHLEAQRALYQELFAQAPVAVALLNGPKHVIQLANPLVCTIWGRKPEELLGKTLLDALPEIQGQGFDVLLDGVRETGIAYTGCEVPARLDRAGRGTLETVYFNFVYEPLRDTSGSVQGIVIIAVDVTTQVVARQIIAEKAKQSAFAAQVGDVLTGDEPLNVQLRRCCEAVVAFGAAFARIWTLNEADNVLELQASAGLYTHLNGAHARIPVGQFKIGRIAAERQAHLTNSVVEDPLVSDRAWARREGMVAFAGYPLVLGDRLIGVMALFSRAALSDETLSALGSVAKQIAMSVERDRIEWFREVFIGMLGHDLRNPLSAVLTGAHVLSLNPAVPDGAKRTADRIQSSAGRMSRMVDQLLDYARTRSGGGIPIVAVPANMFAICREALEELQEANPSRTFEVIETGEGDGEWDVDRMSQVFSNLLGNAVAYGSADQTIRVRVWDDGAHIQCEVHSFGPAIPVSAQPHIFDPFRRVDQTRAYATKGLGLGLFITKEVIRAHGGTITVSSSEIDGTSFQWSLPKGAQVTKRGTKKRAKLPM